LLARARADSPFHAARLAGVDPERVELADLAHLPTMTKGEMMAGFDEVLTDRRLGRRAVEAHLAASVERPSLLHGDHVCLASGGSSGERGVFVQTGEEFTEFAASLLRAGVARAAASGDGPPVAPGGATTAVVAAGSPVHASGFGSAVATSGPVRLVQVPASLPLAEVVARLNDVRPTSLLGYSTVLARLAAERAAGRLRIAPRSVTATSEPLTDEDRATITAGFGVPVDGQFASTEGLVGHGEPDDRVLTFASDLCLVEVVDEANRPVPCGAPSAKVLVTNLHNLTQPLIRYELTDRFVRHPDSPGGHLRAEVEGRADDVFRFGDVEVHPLVTRSVMVQAPAVAEYQVRQRPRGLDVSVVLTGRCEAAELEARLRQALRAAGLVEPEVHVVAVDRVPRHPQTGKVRRFVPC
jgi:phenylacetate-coenzyme A ligase PaaK-like adenylate-forming protein